MLPICGTRMIAATAILLLCSALRAAGQSTDVRFPTTVAAREIAGAIPARDIGDSRLTDHFYTFNGSPGDLLITVESKNLNGDFDVFTAAELRPVMKITVYAEASTPVTKDIYLRKSESLILRVEARSPNDDEGSYSIRFSGSFEPASRMELAESGKPDDERSTEPGKSSDRKTTRVSSVGARIDQPADEVAATPTPEPTLESTPAASTERPPASAAKKTVAGNPAARRPRGRPAPTNAPVKPAVSDADKATADSSEKGTGEAVSATTPAKTEKKAKADADVTTSPATSESTSESETARAKSTPTERKTGKPSARKPSRPAEPESPPENTQRLLIEVKDGTQIEYLMSTVKRVTVENGVVVILGKLGNVQRVPMSSIVRMSIGP